MRTNIPATTDNIVIGNINIRGNTLSKKESGLIIKNTGIPNVIITNNTIAVIKIANL